MNARGRASGSRTHEAYRGQLVAFGTTSGHRFVVSCWDSSPRGTWCAVLVAEPDYRRRLFAPSPDAVDDVLALHDVDVVSLAAVEVNAAPGRWLVTVGHCSPGAGSPEGETRIEETRAGAGERRGLALTITIGRRSRRGALVACLPERLKETRAFALFTEAGLRVLSLVRPALGGVHAVGTIRDGRREFHCARDERIITGVTGHYLGADVGALADLTPCGFGFSDPPPRPALGRMTALRRRPSEHLPHEASLAARRG